jgi:hypothetical protein
MRHALDALYSMNVNVIQAPHVSYTLTSRSLQRPEPARQSSKYGMLFKQVVNMSTHCCLCHCGLLRQCHTYLMQNQTYLRPFARHGIHSLRYIWYHSSASKKPKISGTCLTSCSLQRPERHQHRYVWCKDAPESSAHECDSRQ